MMLAVRKGLRFGFLTKEVVVRKVWAGMSAGGGDVGASQLMQVFGVWMRGGVLCGRLEADKWRKEM